MTRHPARGPRRHALLASLSGASAALLAGSDAQAGIIVISVNQDFSVANPNTSQDFNLPGGTAFTVFTSNSGASHFIGLASAGRAGTYFKVKGTNSGLLERFRAGPKWGTAPGKALPGGTVSAVTSNNGHVGGGTFTDRFYLFEFKDSSVAGDPLRFGWIEGSLTDDSYSNLTYHLTRYAYDDTGAQIGAGAVPEPSTIMLGGLAAAMVLGAAGVRRWKQAARSARPGAAR